MFTLALFGLALFVLARVVVTVLPSDQHHVLTQFLGMGLALRRTHPVAMTSRTEPVLWRRIGIPRRSVGNEVIHVQTGGTPERDAATPVATGDRLAFSPELRAQTQPRGGWTGRLRESSAERAVMVDHPVEDVLPHLWEIKNVEYCERKADEVTVTPEQPWTGRYVIRGRIFGVLPWTDEFRYVLHEAGFHSEDTGHCRGGLRINGGFTAEPRGAGCRIWHYERYLLPWPLAPLKPVVTAYVRWTQRREMCDLACLIEKLEQHDAVPG